MKTHTLSSKPRIGLVGYGYWGPNLLRNLISNGQCEVIGMVDSDPGAKKRCSQVYPQIPAFESLAGCLNATRPDAMVIATPPATHRAVAMQCLNAGASILVEKPLGLSVAECDEILALADQKNLKVMVDHTFAFHPAVQRIADEARLGNLGDLHYYDSVRVNLGGFQARTNVLWDLAPHDLSILDLLTGGKVPLSVSAIGMKHFDASVENLCYVTLVYEKNFVAHLHLNWVAPVKVRQIMIGGSKKMAIYDENIPTEKVRIYDKGITLEGDSNDFRVNYRVGDMIAPTISNKEALAGMISTFVDYLAGKRDTVSDGLSGRRVVQILEAASLSLSQGGAQIAISSERVQPIRKKAA